MSPSLLNTESEELVEGAFRLDGPVKKRPSADRVQMKHDVVPVPNPSSFYPPLVSQMMPAPAPQPGPMAPVYFMMTPSGFTPVYANGLQWGSMVSDGNAPMQQPQPMVVGWMAIPSSAAPSQPMTASYYPSASASMASTPGLTMPSAAPVTVFGLSPSTPQVSQPPSMLSALCDAALLPIPAVASTAV